MKRNSRLWRTCSAIAIAGMLAATSACSMSGPGESSEDGLTFGVVYKDLSNPYWLEAEAGAKKAAEESDVELLVQSPQNEQAIPEQIDKIRALITQQVDALLVSPNAPDQLRPVLEEATAADIPVILIDTGIPGWDGAATTIGTDNYEAGKIAGEYVAKNIKTGSAAIIGGLPGNPATDARSQAFKDALKGTDVNILTELSANSSRSEAVTVMADMLQAHPDINTVFAPADTMALGAVESIKSAGLDPADLNVFGVDGTKDGANSVKSGELSGTVAQYPYKMGYEGVQSALKVLDGEELDEFTNTGADMIDEKNVDDFLKELDTH